MNINNKSTNELIMSEETKRLKELAVISETNNIIKKTGQ